MKFTREYSWFVYLSKTRDSITRELLMIHLLVNEWSSVDMHAHPQNSDFKFRLDQKHSWFIYSWRNDSLSICVYIYHTFHTHTLINTQIHAHANTPVDTHTNAHVHTHAHAHTHTRTHTCAHTHTHTHTYAHIRTHTYTHTRTHAHAHTHTQTHTHTHTHTNTYIHTHTHTRRHTPI